MFPTIVLLSFAALGIYSVYGPLYSLPADFLTGFAAASGIALVSSVANLGGFADRTRLAGSARKRAVCMAGWRLQASPCSHQRHSCCYFQEERALTLVKMSEQMEWTQ